MWNPLIDNLESLTDTEVDEKVNELSRKYFQSLRFPDQSLSRQVRESLNMFKMEQVRRSRKAFDDQLKKNKDQSKDLDGLINVE